MPSCKTYSLQSKTHKETCGFFGFIEKSLLFSINSISIKKNLIFYKGKLQVNAKDSRLVFSKKFLKFLFEHKKFDNLKINISYLSQLKKQLWPQDFLPFSTILQL